MNDSSSDVGTRALHRLTDMIAEGAINAILGFLVMLARPIATLTEILLRKDMGERYFNFWNVMAGFWVLVFASIPLGVPWPAKAGFDSSRVYHPAQSATLLWCFGLVALLWHAAFAFCAVRQWISVRRRYAAGGRWHSANIGIPRIPRLPVYVERALPFVAGVTLLLFQIYTFGTLMIVSGFITVLLRLHESRAFKNRLLDVIDGQIEQEYFAKAVLERTKPQEVDGLRAPLPAYVSRKFREKVVAAYGSEQSQRPTAVPQASPSTTPTVATNSRSQPQHAARQTEVYAAVEPSIATPVTNAAVGSSNSDDASQPDEATPDPAKMTAPSPQIYTPEVAPVASAPVIESPVAKSPANINGGSPTAVAPAAPPSEVSKGNSPAATEAPPDYAQTHKEIMANMNAISARMAAVSKSSAQQKADSSKGKRSKPSRSK